MEARRKRQKVGARRGAILAICPLCKGTGKVPKKFPFLANPRAPAIRAYTSGLQTCPRCKGSGRVGVE